MDYLLQMKQLINLESVLVLFCAKKLCLNIFVQCRDCLDQTQSTLHLVLKSAANFIGSPFEFNSTEQQRRLKSAGFTGLHRHDDGDVVPASARGLQCR